MEAEYWQLINDTRRMLEEGHAEEKVLLTEHHFQKWTPVPKKVIPPMPLQRAEPIPKPIPKIVPVAPPVKEEKKAPVVLPENHLKELLKRVAPEMRIVDEIPGSVVPKEEVILLSFSETPEEVEFLRNLTQAIHTRLRPAIQVDGREMERENRWSLLFQSAHVRLILSPPVLSAYPRLQLGLMQHEGNKKLHLLEPFSSYFNNPTLKVALWQKICSLL